MRIVVVSNRLPTIVTWEEGELVLQETAGGLVTGLGAWLERSKPDFVWVGWPGCTVPKKEQKRVAELLQTRHKAVPVFVPQASMDKFYLGFCNRTIWPLFHYFPSIVGYDSEQWDKYLEVNQAFLQTVRQVLQPGDVVWIHDYHLMLLPALLRQVFADIPIGFFLHIPFPSFEIFRLLPSQWRRDILQGLLGADLVGFHTHDYCQHFLKCVGRILGYDSYLGSITTPERLVRAETFPMGIDAELYSSLAHSEEVAAARQQLLKGMGDERIILSIDRLDYSKGIPHRLRGFGRFLELHPEWRGRVCLAMVVVPSRIGVDHYQAMKRQIDEVVGDINGQFGDVGWTPIRYQYRMLNNVPLSALYSVSHVGLVTPLRDGMNLVAKEYVASRIDGSGVLILSEMAGASRELGEALMVNPNNPDEIAEALHQALNMPLEEQMARNAAMTERIRRHNVNWWADDFLRSLSNVLKDQRRYRHKPLDAPLHTELRQAWQAAERRLILLDYDGTLVRFYPHPSQARPDASLMDTLRRLCDNDQNTVVVVSGRPRADLEQWFSGLRIYLSAEHGAWTRDASGFWSMEQGLRADWKTEIRPVLQSSAERLPGAFVEEKEFALVWHYRRADPELGHHRAMELQDTLTTLLANTGAQVLPGNRVLEVRNATIHKGLVAARMIAWGTFDFILAIGDDWTDEDLFRALPESAWSIKVGPGASHAHYNLPSQQDVLPLLNELTLAESVVRTR